MQNSPLPGSFYLDPDRFNSVIEDTGINITWRQGKVCPCGAINGTPDPACITCGGFGHYWNPNGVPFIGSVSFSIPDDPSGRPEEEKGIILNSLPILSISSTDTVPWTNASLFDQFVFTDNIVRFTESLITGQRQALAYSFGATVAASGAVNYYDLATKQIVADNNYTTTAVSGITIINITDQPPGTAFNVEYTAMQSFIAIGRGGLPHSRPELAGGTFPKRFQLNPSDIFLRGISTTGQYS